MLSALEVCSQRQDVFPSIPREIGQLPPCHLPARTPNQDMQAQSVFRLKQLLLNKSKSSKVVQPEATLNAPHKASFKEQLSSAFHRGKLHF